jgi:Flp pilus assembly protein CpaB
MTVALAARLSAARAALRSAVAATERAGATGRLAAVAALALAAGVAAVWHLRRQESALRARFAPVEIVVAARPVVAAAPLAADDLTVAALPRDALPGGALVPAAVPALVGRRLVAGLQAGDPVLASLVEERDGGRPLARDVSPGRRAIALPIEPAFAVAGFLEPGDRVDVLLLWQEGAQGRVATLLERVPLLAVGDRRRPGGTPFDATTAVLEVSAADAEALLLALDRGRLALALRAPEDQTARPSRKPTTLDALLPGRRGTAGPSLEVIHGAR